MTQSLRDFASEKMKKKCWICELPQRREIDEAYNKGVPRKIIREWLIDVAGYADFEVKISYIDNHFSDRHHLKGVDLYALS